jgi:flagellar biosynthesis/type III secretory pathway M-ring protein FliF/YscJ
MWWPWIVLLALAALGATAIWRKRRRSGAERQSAHLRTRRPDELPPAEVGGFRSWQADDFAFEHEVKRSEAEQASRTAEFYARLAGEQEARAETLKRESREAAERAGLEDVRHRHLETDADQATGER